VSREQIKDKEAGATVNGYGGEWDDAPLGIRRASELCAKQNPHLRTARRCGAPL